MDRFVGKEAVAPLENSEKAEFLDSLSLCGCGHEVRHDLTEALGLDLAYCYVAIADVHV